MDLVDSVLKGPDLTTLSLDNVLNKRRTLRKTLLAREGLQCIRIAVLGGVTSTEVVNLLEVLLLNSGFSPTFYESEYGLFYENAVYNPEALIDFRPDIIYIYTCCFNVRQFPLLNASTQEFRDCLAAEAERYEQIWKSLRSKMRSVVIQNNFELPQEALLGNMDAVSSAGRSRFLLELNRIFACHAEHDSTLLIQDIHRLSAQIGLDAWFDAKRWFSYKIPMTVEANFKIARSLTAMIGAIYGKVRKVLVLDLDNTLWGGVIGDEGADKIQIGAGNPIAEAYSNFQEYCLSLHQRGVLLAVCSKNDEATAKEGFAHPDSILKLEHISCFKANWLPKPENILAIARELNLGTDTFVFVDDNPAERALVAANIPDIAVPEIGNDVDQFVHIVQAGRHFEPVSLSSEDLERSALYASDRQRTRSAAAFADHGAYLDSLQMRAEIAGLSKAYLDRIVQLTNKSNQFNLTTRRYTIPEMEAVMNGDNHIGIYGKLMDKFGDNGLVSVVIGERDNQALHIILWLMSCRVLQRTLERAMLDELVERSRAQGVSTIYGYYFPTSKNNLVANHYHGLGFEPHLSERRDLPQDSTAWVLNLRNYSKINRHIKVFDRAYA